MRRIRHVTKAEQALWDLVTRQVEPLRARASGPTAVDAPPNPEPAKQASREATASTSPEPSTSAASSSSAQAAGRAQTAQEADLERLREGLGTLGRHGATARTPATVSTASAAPTPDHAGIERAHLRRLKRGLEPIDATLDLHGMTQEAAHRRLRQFLAHAQRDGDRTVLVITGTGRARGQESVLRQAVPRWLSEPAFHHLNRGVVEAHRRHGGEGAFYVLLRRKRSKS
ncbi:MAG: Smr/MutS family protein [Geminicoccaceae bacterium]